MNQLIAAILGDEMRAQHKNANPRGTETFELILHYPLVFTCRVSAASRPLEICAAEHFEFSLAIVGIPNKLSRAHHSCRCFDRDAINVATRWGVPRDLAASSQVIKCVFEEGPILLPLKRATFI